MIAAPATHTAAPIRSQRSGRVFSTVQSQTLISREIEIPPAFIDANNINLELTGVPESKLFLYADWAPLPGLRVVPSLEMAGARWTVTSSSAITPVRYYQTGTYALMNLSLSYDLNDHVSILLAGKNLTNRNYVLVDGFPEEGRNFTLSLKLRN